jgi:hypothetical protein
MTIPFKAHRLPKGTSPQVSYEHEMVYLYLYECARAGFSANSGQTRGILRDRTHSRVLNFLGLQSPFTTSHRCSLVGYFSFVGSNAPASPWYGRTVQDATRYTSAGLLKRKTALALHQKHCLDER